MITSIYINILLNILVHWYVVLKFTKVPMVIPEESIPYFASVKKMTIEPVT